MKKSQELKEQKIRDIASAIKEQKFEWYYQAVVETMEAKIRIIADELAEEAGRDVVKYVSGRLKRPESIYAKLLRKKIEPTFDNALHSISDVIGIRVVCIFLDDVYHVAERLKACSDITVKKEKDYIKTPKKNGYTSLHLIVTVPICVEDETIEQRIEIQIRTMAMDYWSVLDHQMIYKKESKAGKKAVDELKNYAKEVMKLDKKMLSMRKEIEKIKE